MAIRTEIDHHVLIVTLDRPDRRNAVDHPTSVELARAFRDFDADDSLAVAVLNGAHGVFCSGADLKAMRGGEMNRVRLDGDGPMGPSRMELSKPVIAAIEGFAVAGGLELAIWCDLRVCARDATLGVFCRRWGVPLVDGGTVRLPRLVGHGRAMDLILSGRAVGADEALAIGLVNRVVEPGTALVAARTWAHELAALPQTTMRSDRRAAIDSWSLDHAAAMANETALGLASLASGGSADVDRFVAGEGRGGAPSGSGSGA